MTGAEGPQHGLWSLWEMLERYALIFSEVVGSLQTAQSLWRPSTITPLANALIGMGKTPEQTEEDRRDEEFRRSYLDDTLDAARTACEMAGLTSVFPEIARLRGATKGIFPASAANVSRDIQHLRSRLRDELQNEYFLHVSRVDHQLYGKPDGFGPEVAIKFPTGIEDVGGAGNCLALGQPTACVFHLMRLCEIGVRALAKKLRVTTIDLQTANWDTISQEVNKAIQALPAKKAPQKARKTALAGASVYLNGVRIATRNEVMHPKKTYTMEEARDVFQATRLFMRYLATLV